MAEMPRIILHNSVSIDGSLTNFEPDMELHYRIAGEYKPEAHLIGSVTVRTGAEMFGEGIPEEDESDFVKPIRSNQVPYWIIPDSKGMLKGILHTCRRFEFCRDVIVLISKTTPEDYITHLKERNYTYLISGEDHVDLKKSIETLSEEYGIKTILTDTGSILGNYLINNGMVDEISLLVHPVIVGRRAYPVFSYIEKNSKFSLVKSEVTGKGLVWLVYRPEKSDS